VRRLVTTLIAGILLALPASALATDVTVNDSNYDPASVKVKAGTTVTWTWATTLGRSVTSDTNAFDSGLKSAPATFSQLFDVPGIYGYHDTGSGQQTGTVTAYGAPSLTVNPPTSAITRGQSVNFQASANTNPSGGALTYEWDLDGDGIYETAGGTAQTVAYPAAGSFTVAVRVTDEVGNQTTATASVQVGVPDSDGDGLNDDADQCPTIAAATPDGCPLVIPPVPPAIKSSVVSAGQLGLAGALKSGVNTLLNCSAACTGFFTLSRGGNSVAVPLSATLNGSGSKVVTLRFTSSAKRALAKLKTVRLQLQVLVTDAITRVQTRKAAVVLMRVRTLGRLPAIGISDNQPATFADPNFRVLRLRYARLVSPWNAIFTERGRLDAWLQAARGAGVRPLVSFEHSRGMVCPGKRCKGPTKAQYTRAWKAFHKKYPWVKDISPWNEVNSATQPPGKRPDLAALYYNVVRSSCRGCTIVAADLLDGSNIRRYAASFLRAAKGKPRLWGLHNYTDTNRFRSRGTAALLQSVRGTVWLTETGGVVRFVTQKGVVALPKSESRAKKAMDYMFRLAELNARRIKRIYVYQWKINNRRDRFDAGVVRPDGSRRPSFNVLSVNASIARKR
jgi:polysaccharide biosynthesis protein PslG